jgi:drug/metabolite transporter (DMT)-like permease
MSLSTKVTFGLMVICMIWGSTWLAIKVGLQTVPPFFAASFRFFIAAAILLAILRVRGLPIQGDKSFWNMALILGLLSFSIPFASVYWGQKQIPSSLASILFATFPFCVAIFSHLRLPGEPMTVPKVLGVVFGFIGVYVIFASEVTFASEKAELGMAAIVVSALMQAFALVSLKKRGRGMDVISLNFIGMIIGAVVLLGMSLAFEDHREMLFDRTAILSLLYLSIFGSVIAFVTYFWLVKHVEVVLLSLTAFVTPIIAVLLGKLVLDEHLSPQVLSGSILVLGGILIANATDVLEALKKGRAFLFDGEGIS